MSQNPGDRSQKRAANSTTEKYPVVVDRDDRLPTAVRFVGGASDRFMNLVEMLQYIDDERPTESALKTWFLSNTASNKESTYEKQVPFIGEIRLISLEGEDCRLTEIGEEFLDAYKASGDREYDILFHALRTAVIGFDYLLARLEDGPIPLDRRNDVLTAAYEEFEPASKVPSKHYTWLQVIDYIDKQNGEYEITPRGRQALSQLHAEEIAGQVMLSDRSSSPLRPRSPTSDSEYDAVASDDQDPTTSAEISYTADLAQIQERTRSHEQALDLLTERLRAAGYDCFETKHSDLIASRDGRVILVEAKTLTPESAMAQVRKAIGQLLEYEYYDIQQRGTWDDCSVETCLFVTPPPDGQFETYLEWICGQGIEVIWLENQTIEGPSQWLVDALE